MDLLAKFTGNSSRLRW